MSSIVVQDLAHSAVLDPQAMSAVRGGTNFGAGLGKDINVEVNVNQQIGQFQQIGVNVLNGNGVIGAPIDIGSVKVPAKLWAENHVSF